MPSPANLPPSRPTVGRPTSQPLPAAKSQVAIGTRSVYTSGDVPATLVGATHVRPAGPPPQLPPRPSQHALAGAPSSRATPQESLRKSLFSRGVPASNGHRGHRARPRPHRAPIPVKLRPSAPHPPFRSLHPEPSRRPPTRLGPATTHPTAAQTPFRRPQPESSLRPSPPNPAKKHPAPPQEFFGKNS